MLKFKKKKFQSLILKKKMVRLASKEDFGKWSLRNSKFWSIVLKNRGSFIIENIMEIFRHPMTTFITKEKHSFKSKWRKCWPQQKWYAFLSMAKTSNLRYKWACKIWIRYLPEISMLPKVATMYMTSEAKNHENL